VRSGRKIAVDRGLGDANAVCYFCRHMKLDGYDVMFFTSISEKQNIVTYDYRKLTGF
jgi:hypothetical protein